jgi:hypothetical protein
MQKELQTYCELHWWNCGKKTLSFKGELVQLLAKERIKYTKRKTEIEGIFIFKFKNDYGITFEQRGLLHDFKHYAKQFIQMELVRMGDKSQLHVNGCFRPTVTVNF